MRKTVWHHFLDIATVIVAFCTLTLTGVAIYDRVSVLHPAERLSVQPPKMLDEWQAIAATGHRSGPEDAAITVVVFSDFECPMCRTFATRTYPEFQALYPGQSALVFRHWPLDNHRFAYPAAKASECAAAQDRFQQFHDLLFAKQQELGLKAFHDFADEAGVPNLPAFDLCFSGEASASSIERDIREVKRIGGTGTPTVIVNGWLLRGGVGLALLDSIAGHLVGPE